MSYAHWLGFSIPTQDEWEIAETAGVIETGDWEQTFSDAGARRSILDAMTRSTLCGMLVHDSWRRLPFGFRCVRRQSR
jgi:hypothetical protein